MQKSQNKPQSSDNSATPTRRLVETLKLKFDLPLNPSQIYQFRGAVADAAGWENNLFHNHGYQSPSENLPGAANEENAPQVPSEKEVFRQAIFYRYPLIQYRCEDGKAVIWGMGDGIKALQQWLNQGLDTFRMGGRRCPLRIIDFKGTDFYLEKTKQFYTYRLMDWLALNQENYEKWNKIDRYTERIKLLEEVLAGHLLGFATAANWQIPNRFEVYLHNVRSVRPVKVHGSERMAFNVLYRTNLKLPAGVAIGRSVAFGFGVQQPTRKQF